MIMQFERVPIRCIKCCRPDQPRKWILKTGWSNRKLREITLSRNRILKEYIFSYGSVSFSFFLSSFKISRIAVSIFVKNYGLHDWQRFIVPYRYLIFPRFWYAVEDFQKSPSHTCFLIKFSYGPYTRKPFTWKVMLFVMSLFILFHVVFCVCCGHPSVSICMHVLLVYNLLSLFTSKSNTFFIASS